MHTTIRYIPSRMHICYVSALVNSINISQAQLALEPRDQTFVTERVSALMALELLLLYYMFT